MLSCGVYTQFVCVYAAVKRLWAFCESGQGTYGQKLHCRAEKDVPSCVPTCLEASAPHAYLRDKHGSVSHTELAEIACGCDTLVHSYRTGGDCMWM
jgi:hypothetical protein